MDSTNVGNGFVDAFADTVVYESPHSHSGTDGSPAKSIGQYETIAPISSGGMGIIYRALQPSVGREVAVKMIRPEKLSDELLQRFKTESTAIGRLQHPNVIQIIEAGEHDGNPFFSMELASVSLEDRLHQEALKREELVQLVAVVARAIHSAHDRGILHRDLKPSNILFTDEGVPKVSDFGLAKIFDVAGESPRQVTQDNTVLGTPHYMAPEQARGDIAAIGPKTDVYALAAILYRLLAGRPPFVGKNQLEVLAAVREETPELPSVHGKFTCPDLDAICMQGLEKEPADRYESAASFADDLERWIARQPSQAKLSLRRRSRRRWMIGVTSAAAVAATTYSIQRMTNPSRIAAAHLDELHVRLAKQETIAILGERGLPGWYQLIGDQKLASFSVTGDENVATLRSTGNSMLVLMDNPQTDSYRFEIEILHKQIGPGTAWIGVFVAQWNCLNANHTFVGSAVRFNEIDDEAAIRATAAQRRKNKNRHPQPIPEGNAVRLSPYVATFEDGNYLNGSTLPGRIQRYIRKRNKWRHVSIHVSPDSINAFWDRRDEPLLLLKSEMTRRVKDDFRDRGISEELESRHAFNPRGSMGILVNDSEVSFRNCLLQPL